MQWSDAPNAGFCAAGATPWLPLHPGYRDGVSVAAQADDPASLRSFYRRLLALRRTTPALVAGDFAALHPDGEACLAFLRHDAGSGQRCLVVLNFSPEAQQVTLDPGPGPLSLRFSSEARAAAALEQHQLRLAPFEIRILDVGDPA